ncbi:MAG TPA: hypothetical protein VNT55_00815, partial [Baekduia sp.]|nr:hypothetical protein [Baekduia sp.]
GFSPARVLAGGQLIGRPQLAVAGNGRALIAWIELTHGGTRRIVRIAERPPGGSFGAPATLSGRGRADVLTAAANARGDQVVAFVRDGEVLARVRRPGRGWGSIQRLARATSGTQWQLAAAIDDRGQVRVVWRRHQLRRESAPGRTALESAAVLVGRNTFTAAQTLTADGASATFRIARIPNGWAVADVETTTEGPRPALHRTHGGSQFSPVEYAAPAQGGTRAADVAFSPAAGITVAWVVPLPGQDSDGVARAASLIGDAFGPVQDVSPPEAVHEVRLAGDVAVWTARPEGTGPSIPIGQIRTVVRSAQRTP